MNLNYLDFEQPIAELEAKIEELRLVGNDNNLNISEEIARLKQQSEKLTKDLFSNLDTDQVMKLARHPLRPYFSDYIPRIFEDFDEMHGDRHFADDAAIIGGTARLNGQPVMIIGQDKGRQIDEKVKRNFGMPHPEGYRKALRLMETAERFKLPVFTFIDTAGAYPGKEAEERGQSEAIAYNLLKMSSLKTPIICTVTGEGGSGGALALGVGDYVNMLQYSTYSVITPEGCASILWRTADKAKEAAEAMGIAATRVHELGLADSIIDEPLGGAHRDYDATAASIKAILQNQLSELQGMNTEQLVDRRYDRLMAYGALESA